MSDLVKRLRHYGSMPDGAMQLAADKIEELEAKLAEITQKHIELGDKLPAIHAHDRWLMMENVIKSEPILEDKS